MQELVTYVKNNVEYSVFHHNDKVILFKDWDPVNYINLDDEKENSIANGVKKILSNEGISLEGQNAQAR